MTVNNFSTALEAKRCIDALDRIESDILARAKNDLAEIGLFIHHFRTSKRIVDRIQHHRDGIFDATDSGLRSMKRELQEEWRISKGKLRAA